MFDSFCREINYMRISITDRCNLRCRYCMPEDISLNPMEDILRYEEILEICQQAVGLGIHNYKITGGEPLVRLGCPDLIRELKQTPGVKQVTLTTNGVLLADYLEDLIRADIDGVNVSLDTMDPDKYAKITGFSRLTEVLSGIRLALDAGLKLKINCVLQEGINGEDWEEVLKLAQKNPLDVRFIELMPIGYGKKQRGISNDRILGLIQDTYGKVKKDDRIHGNGPAVYYTIPGFEGSLGLISPIHGRFCDNCNRIRMTSTGQLKSCLCYEQSYSIREAVRQKDRARVREIIKECILHKPEMHHFENVKKITERKKMVQIGG
ncbi:MAG: GTP 3',8-cyclase MoaA [Eubacterium sp.]|nr:GTP 3',8-cyclase MoaA [Eubacterium sp.]